MIYLIYAVAIFIHYRMYKSKCEREDAQKTISNLRAIISDQSAHTLKCLIEDIEQNFPQGVFIAPESFSVPLYAFAFDAAEFNKVINDLTKI